jgi:hypothetical protein
LETFVQNPFDEFDLCQAAGFMENVFSFADTQLDSLDELIKKDIRVDGDSSFFDDAEYLHGIGFVAGQRYITSVCATLKVKRKWALSIGPKPKNRTTYASVVNTAANYWKHSDEWDFNDLTDLQKSTLEAIKSLDVAVSEREGCVTTNIMHQLGLNKFSDLAARLKDWSIAVVDRKNKATQVSEL